MNAEQIIADTLMTYLGSPMWAGLIILFFFIAWAVVMRMRLEVALVGLIPTFILASAFIPGLHVLIAMVGGALLGFILMRLAVR